MSVLHPTRTYPALVPRYVSRFRCIGPECEDNCCTGWRVDIDKKTFNVYRDTMLPTLKKRFSQDIKRQRSQASDAIYAKIELKPDTRECPFMEQRLCAIQREMGEDKLSDTCFSYPRSSRKFGGQFEQALTLSCPEAARLALSETDALDFVEGSITVRAETVKTIRPVRGMPLDLMNEVRIFCIQLMRTDGLELWQKLAVLGLFCENLTEALGSGGHATVPSLLQNFTAMVQGGQVVEALADMQPDTAMQAVIFAALLGIKNAAKTSSSATQKAVRQAVADGLGADPETGQVAQQQLIERYRSGISRLPEALKAAPHLLENYVLNEMYRELFPFDGPSPYEHYLRIISRFGLLRLMLAAQCNTDGELPRPEALVRTIQVFCRLYQHDTSYAMQVNTVLRNTGWDKLERLYRFLRT